MEYIRDRSCLDLVKSGTISLLWDLSPTWTFETWTLSAKAILRLRFWLRWLGMTSKQISGFGGLQLLD